MQLTDYLPNSPCNSKKTPLKLSYPDSNHDAGRSEIVVDVNVHILFQSQDFKVSGFRIFRWDAQVCGQKKVDGQVREDQGFLSPQSWLKLSSELISNCI